MAGGHVPTQQEHQPHPIQGQNIYNSPAFESLYPVEHYDGQQPWNPQLAHHPALAPNGTNPAWHQSPYTQQPYGGLAQSYANPAHGHRTASPYQYGQFGNHSMPVTYGHAANVDPALGMDPNAVRQQHSPFQIAVQNASPQNQPGTVTPQSLQQNIPVQSGRPTASPYQAPPATADFADRNARPVFSKPPENPDYDIPKGRKSGGFVMHDKAALAKATKSTTLNNLVTVGSEPLHLATNRTALPQYTPRQSTKDLKKAESEGKKLARRGFSKSSSGHRLNRDASDSESYDDSTDDGSEYSDDEIEQSPLPPSRPDDPQAAVRYDIIKAAWHPRQSPMGPEKIKTSLREVWEIFNTIHKRWRNDAKAVTEAEEQKKTGELPVLKSRVTSQRDLLLCALKSALEFAHPDVLYHLGQVKGFLYLCYQFLANRFKTQDYDGPLPSAIIEILARCLGTMTTELLEETKLNRALGVMKKYANEKHQALIQQILDGAAAGSKKAQVMTPPETDVAPASKTAKRPAAQLPVRTAGEVSASKKLKSGEPAVNGDKKPAATTASSKAAPANAPALKRPGEKGAPAPVKARVVNKPSSLLASLNPASKKPATGTASAKLATKSSLLAPNKKPVVVPAKTFSFKDTMAQLLKPKEEEVAAPSKAEKQLPPETPEEKAKRERKESRRHLRVKFRTGDALVSVKYFSHHPEEESGHDENFVRDAGDVGGEGRMFRQHKDMIDEDEDEDLEIDLLPWRTPSRIDFSVIPYAERSRNYDPYGGGLLKPNCPEKEANIAHERATLSVYYAHPSDIPSSPREPLLQQTQAPDTVPISFGPPPDIVLRRCPESSRPVPTPDISNLENIIKRFNMAAPTPLGGMVPSAPQPPAAPDIASILNAFKPVAAPTPVSAPMAFPNLQQPALPLTAPVVSAAPSAPPIDFNAIMALLGQTSTATAPAPPASVIPNWPQLQSAFPQLQTQHQDANTAYLAQQPQQDQASRGGHKRQREDANDDRGYGSIKRNRGERGRLPHKVIPCRFFQKGLCAKGDDCTYIHDLN